MTTEQKHTPTPWRYEIIAHAIADTGDYDYSVGIFAEGKRRPFIEIFGEGESDEANARRIVACVNACEGVDNETLEKIASGAKSRNYQSELQELIAKIESEKATEG